MKQKIVIRVQSNGHKGQGKALKAVVGLRGIISASVEGDDKDLIVVTGENIDSVSLTKRLRKISLYNGKPLTQKLWVCVSGLIRKRVGRADLISVTPTDEKKEEKLNSEWTVSQPVWGLYPAPNYGYVVPDYNPNPCCVM